VLGFEDADFRCVLERFHNDLKPLTVPEKTLKAEGFFKTNKVEDVIWNLAPLVFLRFNVGTKMFALVPHGCVLNTPVLLLKVLSE
jgi:hypothetical protein